MGLTSTQLELLTYRTSEIVIDSLYKTDHKAQNSVTSVAIAGSTCAECLDTSLTRPKAVLRVRRDVIPFIEHMSITMLTCLNHELVLNYDPC